MYIPTAIDRSDHVIPGQRNRNMGNFVPSTPMPVFNAGGGFGSGLSGRANVQHHTPIQFPVQVIQQAPLSRSHHMPMPMPMPNQFMPMPMPMPMPNQFVPMPTMHVSHIQPTMHVVPQRSMTLSGPHARVDWKIIAGVVAALACLMLLFPIILI